MSFNSFCNICFVKENIIKLCGEENEPIINILISFASCPDILNGIIYLCINCYNKLEEYDKFRELYLTNFIRFRYLYNEHKKQLEIRNAPDIEKQLKTFVEINVERPRDTPLIENYEAAQALRNDTGYNLDIFKKSDHDLFKLDLDEVVNKNDSSHTDIPFSLANNISEREMQTYYVIYENDCSNEHQENIHGSNVGKRHTDKENKVTESYIVCNVCDESLSCKGDLELHMFTHTNEKQYDCDKCNITFKNEHYLNEHKRTHTVETPYKCDECGWSYIKLEYLQRHKRVHTNENQYKCDECGLEFARRGLLNIHKLKHTGEKLYICDECGFRFRYSSQLKAHKIGHTGEKSYKCEECCLEFTRIYSLNIHQLTHTGGKLYSCNECQKKFRYSSTLREHQRIHVREKV